MTVQSQPTEAAAVPGLKLDAYLPYRLSVASNAVSGLIARAYEDRFGLTIPQWRLICVLAEDGGLTQGAIVSRTGMDKVTVSRAAQGLFKRRLLERSDHHADGRSHVLALTQEGSRLHAEIAPLALAYEAALISGLAPDEVSLLKRLLNRLQMAANALAGDTGEALSAPSPASGRPNGGSPRRTAG
ncbi:MAG: MarR family winged helix-turn-helix transcriptional regulator [Phenylobacterium sp.]|uniref:MarR family winged helix-turn-helix transcriptional regulator n=1 Tax=Phenylobacterium sp. TaxID=1871053 RepID=UPI00272851B4|nr:MarR family winged helix-turn-helix transcriptional regulator [Phenylobacterium sp.]MDO8910854.1 MarR family winged helix-turn-helix transcriptional regulator [Phenylobacterium sp.]MDO9247684.1 MarR family winged helix-turn-helix transcriptional regulator [Phenylobacterium sp.]MDP2010674.1 MarR family winged helix-turn-helix transcriptional regulator [Phenylobacterium sp.]MDP3102508.1 MarR family winged helix-turn-helix transcriptional regulator [Phenylobacterium sp.]MDP3632027.1 MarR famil